MYVCIGCPADYDGLDDDHDDCEPRVVTVEEATSNPCPASSASASSSAVWPPELRLWVERSFGQCRNNRDRGRCEKYLKERISTANALGPQGHALACPATLPFLPMLLVNTCNTHNTHVHVEHCVMHAI